MFDKLAELYFNFWDKVGVGADIALMILFFFAAYFVIKNAVKKGVVSAYEEIKREKKHLNLIDQRTENTKSKDSAASE